MDHDSSVQYFGQRDLFNLKIFSFMRVPLKRALYRRVVYALYKIFRKLSWCWNFSEVSTNRRS